MKRTRLFASTFIVANAFAFTVAFQSASESFGQEKLPRLEPAQCFFQRGDWARDAKIECKWLVVPESHENPNSRTIKLAVEILRARHPDGSPPLLLLPGGPGQSGIESFTRDVIEARLDQQRDILIYDQRGAGYSEPKLCPEFKDIERDSQKLKTEKRVEAVLKAAIRKCVASLDARIDRAAYSTAENADDLIDLRHSLGYTTWDIYSVSYGTRLAQEAMRRDGKAIRSVTLDKPVTRGPDWPTELARTIQRAFERVFADCNDQPECHAAFPTLEKDFYEIYDDLNSHPLSVEVNWNSSKGYIVLDGKRFLSRMRNDVLSAGDPQKLSRFPLLINEFRRGDKMRASKILVGYNPETAHPGNSVLSGLVNCYDLYGRNYVAGSKATNATVRLPFRLDALEECRIWQKRFADPAEWEPIRSDIPTLILTGRYDGLTPTELGKRIASTLSRVHLYEFPNEAHGPKPGPCHVEIVIRFWADPFREPETSCISKLQPIKFLTKWDEAKPPQNGHRTNDHR